MGIYLGEDKVAGGVIGDVVKRQMLTAFTVTTNSSGYAAVPSDIKPTLPTNAAFLGYFINTWQSTSPAAAFNVTNNGAWVISAPNVTINGLQLFVLYKIPGSIGASEAAEPENAMQYRRNLGSNEDFNSLTTVGYYIQTNDNQMLTCTNRPCDLAGKLYVINAIGLKTEFGDKWDYFLQLYLDYTGHLYCRHLRINGTMVTSFGTWAQRF